jgi:hypothetical protein
MKSDSNHQLAIVIADTDAPLLIEILVITQIKL